MLKRQASSLKLGAEKLEREAVTILSYMEVLYLRNGLIEAMKSMI